MADADVPLRVRYLQHDGLSYSCATDNKKKRICLGRLSRDWQKSTDFSWTLNFGWSFHFLRFIGESYFPLSH